MTRKFTPTASTPLSLLSIDDTLFLPVPVVERLLQKRLSRAITFPGGGSFQGGHFCLERFWPGILFAKRFVFTGSCRVASETARDTATA